MALSGLRAGGADGHQSLLLGLRNDGNVLVKGRGRLVVTDADGDRVQDAHFPIDTFVAHTGIQFPVAIGGQALPAGRYHAVAELRYAGRTTRRVLHLSISDRQAAQVFRSRSRASRWRPPSSAVPAGGRRRAPQIPADRRRAAPLRSVGFAADVVAGGRRLPGLPALVRRRLG